MAVSGLLTLLSVLLLLLIADFRLVFAQQQHQQIVFGAGSDHQHKEASIPQRQKRVAIIGAGPGGSSTAFFLSKAQEKLQSLGRSNEGFEVTLFEKEERIGGRTAIVHPYYDVSLPAIELGASIFADVNQNLKRAAKDFNLETNAKLGEQTTINIWDGQQFIVEGFDNGWWNSAKLFWRYGYSPMNTQKLVKEIVDRFLRLYDPLYLHKESEANHTDSGYPWPSIERLAKAMTFEDLAAQSAGDYFYSKGVAKLFIEEMIEAASLVNYGQEIYSIHGVGGGVSLAASGAVGVQGGNYRIFEEMLGKCENLKIRLGIHGEVTGLARFKTRAEVIEAGKMTIEEASARGHLMNQPTSIADSLSPSTTKWWLGTKSGFGDLYDAVFIAAPWHSSGIVLLNTHSVIPAYNFVHLHVTILVTSAKHPNPTYFGRGNKDEIPTSILTSHVGLRRAEEKRRKEEAKRQKGKRSLQSRGWWPGSGDDAKKSPSLDFNSLTYLTPLKKREGEEATEHVVKIFSMAELSDDKLEEIFGKDQVKWIHRKEWDAYPYLKPTREFAPVEVDDNLYNPSAMEALISTMETSTVSARNAVALYLEKLFGFDFIHGGDHCPWDRAEGDEQQGDWAGWGCEGG